ncbi:acyl-homoserine-lactone synthase [Candidatus Nucleicultrix amoebiphila]|uniref:Uncharacterized protein n=1 Tax=Candidatus Nucleicultrix amoebiphila FS5 TaxID=1414854 RepID=A0A1W6N380_9PROT|nr:acyl-homoserine-lactone synthase [Candidatus Nucleicultrix amoebiphila]ARN84258.1 hypothetical protein GQ61_01675 [Candidatus Nucleicultrix amoebiphila FS5]
MFHIVTPQNRLQHSDLLSHLFSRTSAEDDKFDTSETVYLIAIDDTFGIIGSARLLSSPSASLSQNCVERVGLTRDQRIWECNKIRFLSGVLKKFGVKEEEIVALKKKFYEEFYKTLQTFAQEKAIEVYLTVTKPPMHEELEGLGQWPFLVSSTTSHQAASISQEHIVGVLPVF